MAYSGRVKNKDKGTLWEYAFFTEALRRGFEVYVPAGDNLTTDCILCNDSGELFKVQIKGTQNPIHSPDGFYRYKIIACTGRIKKKPLDCRQVDILAAYIAERDLWYIIPCAKLNGKKGLWFYPHVENSKARLEVYKEAWDLIN